MDAKITGLKMLLFGGLCPESRLRLGQRHAMLRLTLFLWKLDIPVGDNPLSSLSYFRATLRKMAVALATLGTEPFW